MKIDSKPIKSDSKRYEIVAQEKADGATYTPKVLADFVAQKIVKLCGNLKGKSSIKILDPAIGDGELIISLLEEIPRKFHKKINVYGFETDQKAINLASARLKHKFPDICINFQLENFLNYALENFGAGGNGNLFESASPLPYDIIIANPPYVRTQILGFSQAQILSQQFGLSGRVDLYYAFIFAMAWVLKPNGTAGIIVSNRFMTTKSGSPVRKALQELFNINHIWDLGDTKIFEAAVLPSVLLVEGKNGGKLKIPDFTTIYQTNKDGRMSASNPIEALSCKEGIVKVEDGRNFFIQHGKLETDGEIGGVWRVGTKSINSWLATVKANTWGTFADIGKIRVGVKTCADKIFIRSDWQDMPTNTRPEVLRPLVTHHNAQRFQAKNPVKTKQILYTHEVSNGQRQAIKLSKYPRTKAYLNSHRSILEGRKYVIEAGREWHEIWVPQDPTAWDKPKMVFRDISKEPTFWIDKEGSIINGDCYWLICQDESQVDLLWLATAIGNSTFIEKYYDCRFNNKLYAGRRRFITQYVEKFPLPDPNCSVALAIIKKAKRIYECIPSQEADRLQNEIDEMVNQVFGLTFKER
ncbi:MAG: Eco57I restriction-modification methylase domain-containing protein [Candidatus Anammoxibacter sp.]